MAVKYLRRCQSRVYWLWVSPSTEWDGKGWVKVPNALFYVSLDQSGRDEIFRSLPLLWETWQESHVQWSFITFSLTLSLKLCGRYFLEQHLSTVASQVDHIIPLPIPAVGETSECKSTRLKAKGLWMVFKLHLFFCPWPYHYKGVYHVGMLSLVRKRNRGEIISLGVRALNRTGTNKSSNWRASGQEMHLDTALVTDLPSPAVQKSREVLSLKRPWKQGTHTLTFVLKPLLLFSFWSS